jgi:quinol monooxygenase YgiN
MDITYGFNATLTAKQGMGDQLVTLLLSGLDEGNPGSNEHCLVYLVSRSASDPDVAHVTEGWTTEEDHHRVFASDAAQAIVSQFADLVAGEALYTDYVPVNGKAVF